MENGVAIKIRLPAADLAKLEALAAAADASVSWVVRAAIREYLAKEVEHATGR